MLKIGFSTSRGLISRAIRWFTNSKVSHAWILHEAYGGLYVMEAEATGFRVVSYEEFKKGKTNIVTYDVEELLLSKGIDPKDRLNRTAEWLGDSYDYVGILKFLVKPVLSLFWKGPSTPKQLMCSEAVTRFAPELFPGVDPEWSTPEMLRKLLEGLDADHTT